MDLSGVDCTVVNFNLRGENYMRNVVLTITDEESEILGAMSPEDRQNYVENMDNGILPEWLAYGYGFYGIRSLDGTRLTVIAGDCND